MFRTAWQRLMKRARAPRRPVRLRLEPLEDRITPTTFTVTSTLDDGSVGSLRWAISQNDGGGVGNTINFHIPAAAGTVETIALKSELPAIIIPVTIDGFTENAFQGAANSHPLIRLDGTSAGAGKSGIILVNVGGCIIQGLALDHFGGAGVVLANASANTIQN